MPGTTSGWTEQHTAVATLLVVALGGALVGLIEDPPVPVWVAAAAAGAAVVALALDVWGGAIVGLVAAVAVVAARRASDLWSTEVFLPALVETTALVAVGIAAGHAGATLRRAAQAGRQTSTSSPFEPVHGSLGLLGRDAALARLQEDMVRGERSMQPVTLVVLDVVSTDASLPPAGRAAAERAVARLVESRAREHDVPFALASDRLGIVFPDAGVATVWDHLGRILEAVTEASFTYGTERDARALADAVDVLVGIARQSATRSTAPDLLQEAVGAVQRARDEEVAT